MCQFLQQQLWHQKTEDAIHDLTKTSNDVAKSLHNSSKLQQDIMANQIETLSYQKEIAEHGTILSQSMEQSRVHVKELMRELRASTDEQKSMIFSIFDRVTKLQAMLLSEVSWLYTILFYGACLLFIYIATSSKRTEDARLWLILIVSFNAFLERLICDFTLDEDDPYEDILLDSDKSIQSLLHHRIWISRKCSIVAAFVVLGFKAFKYKDYNQINFQLLQDIKKQNENLTYAVKILKEGKVIEGNDVLDKVSKEDDELADDEQSEDEEDNLSYISTQTDMTWQHLDQYSDNDDDDLTDVVEDEEYFSSAHSSAQTTPTNNNKDKVTELTPVLPSMNGFEQKKKGRTPSGSRNSSRGATPQRDPNHAYNLRTRKQNQTFNGFDTKESADEFGKLVCQTAKTHRKRRKSIINTLKTNPMHAISENDE